MRKRNILHKLILISYCRNGGVDARTFLLKVRNAGFQGIGFTCGGFIHQTANNEIEYYPLWIDRMNLRFVYRMYKEKHTRKRYVQAALLFLHAFVGETNLFMVQR